MHGPQGLLQKMVGICSLPMVEVQGAPPVLCGSVGSRQPTLCTTALGLGTLPDSSIRAEKAGTHCAAACRRACQAGKAAPPAARRGMSGLLRAPLTAHRRQTGPERSRLPDTSGTAVPCAEGLARTLRSGSDEECSAGWHARVCAPASRVSANADTPDNLQLGCRAVKGLSCSPEVTLTSSASSTSQKTANAPHIISFVTGTSARQDYRTNAELLRVTLEVQDGEAAQVLAIAPRLRLGQRVRDL